MAKDYLNTNTPSAFRGLEKLAFVAGFQAALDCEEVRGMVEVCKMVDAAHWTNPPILEAQSALQAFLRLREGGGE